LARSRYAACASALELAPHERQPQVCWAASGGRGSRAWTSAQPGNRYSRVCRASSSLSAHLTPHGRQHHSGVEVGVGLSVCLSATAWTASPSTPLVPPPGAIVRETWRRTFRPASVDVGMCHSGRRGPAPSRQAIRRAVSCGPRGGFFPVRRPPADAVALFSAGSSLTSTPWRKATTLKPTAPARGPGRRAAACIGLRDHPPRPFANPAPPGRTVGAQDGGDLAPQWPGHSSLTRPHCGNTTVMNANSAPTAMPADSGPTVAVCQHHALAEPEDQSDGRQAHRHTDQATFRMIASQVIVRVLADQPCVPRILAGHQLRVLNGAIAHPHIRAGR